MEGVMMRAPHSYCVAVRKPNGEIVTEEMPAPPDVRKVPDLQVPDLPRRRHAVPGDVAGHEGAASSRPTSRSRSEEDEAKARSRRKSPGWMLAANLIFSLAFFIFMYKFVPLVPGDLARQGIYPALSGRIRVQPDRRPDPHGDLRRLPVRCSR